MKANLLLKHNIDLLLRERGLHRKDLAQWCFRSEGWISKIFQTDKREIPLKYLNRIADFFGKAPYELFLPGRSVATERRVGVDRRSGRERRVGPANRLMHSVGATIETARGKRSVGGGTEHGVAAVSRQKDSLRAIISEAETRLAALFQEETAPRGQASGTRRAKPETRARRRTTRGSNSEKAS